MNHRQRTAEAGEEQHRYLPNSARRSRPIRAVVPSLLQGAQLPRLSYTDPWVLRLAAVRTG